MVLFIENKKLFLPFQKNYILLKDAKANQITKSNL
jgi:hypothetical protein